MHWQKPPKRNRNAPAARASHPGVKRSQSCPHPNLLSSGEPSASPRCWCSWASCSACSGRDFWLDDWVGCNTIGALHRMCLNRWGFCLMHSVQCTPSFNAPHHTYIHWTKYVLFYAYNAIAPPRIRHLEVRAVVCFRRRHAVSGSSPAFGGAS